jgi:hypothetical protein
VSWTGLNKQCASRCRLHPTIPIALRESELVRGMGKVTRVVEQTIRDGKGCRVWLSVVISWGRQDGWATLVAPTYALWRSP